MEPANILFIIAFIGIPIAFGIWALANRRALRQSKRSPRAATPEQPTQTFRQQQSRPAEPAPASPKGEQQPTRQMPAADEQPSPQPAPKPPPSPAPPQQDTQRTRQVPAATIQPAPSPAQQAERNWGWSLSPQAPEPARTSGSSGTTEEFPIVNAAPQSNVPVRADETMELPAVIVPESTPAPAPPKTQTPEPSSPSTLSTDDRRPLRMPRYGGKSVGVVKRFPPGRATKFIGERRGR
jgi:hypothetical protein